MLSKTKMIHGKLLLGFGVVLFILTSTLGFNLWQVGRINRSYSELVDKQTVKVHEILHLQASLLQLDGYIQGYVLTGDEQYLKLIENEKNWLAEQIPNLSVSMKHDNPELMMRFTRNYNYYLNNYVDKVIDTKISSLSAEPAYVQMYEDKIFLLNLMNRGLFGSTIRAVNDIISHEQQSLNDEKHKNYDLVRQIFIWTASAGLLGLLGGGVCTYYVVSSVSTEIRRRRQIEETLRHTNEQLEGRVRERTAHLSKVVKTLENDIAKRAEVEKALRHSENEAQELLQKVQEEITQRKKAEIEILNYQTKLRSLASEITLAEERERRRIATELHDHLGQNLAVAKMSLQGLQEVKLPSSLHEPLRVVNQIVEESIDHVRYLTFRLSPPILYELGLKEGIIWLVERVEERHGIHVRIHDCGLPRQMGDQVRFVLFQAVRELLNNIVKYARVESAAIYLGLDGENIRIVVEDKGVGFKQKKLSQETHNWHTFGLFNIQERLADLGGHLDIYSSPGKGTRAELVVPAIPIKKGDGQGDDKRARQDPGDFS